MSALRTQVYAILVSALTLWGATAASAPMALKQPGTGQCVSVSCVGSYQLSLAFDMWSTVLFEVTL